MFCHAACTVLHSVRGDTANSHTLWPKTRPRCQGKRMEPPSRARLWSVSRVGRLLLTCASLGGAEKPQQARSWWRHALEKLSRRKSIFKSSEGASSRPSTKQRFRVVPLSPWGAWWSRGPVVLIERLHDRRARDPNPQGASPPFDRPWEIRGDPVPPSARVS